jgi:hypothetical protein
MSLYLFCTFVILLAFGGEALFGFGGGLVAVPRRAKIRLIVPPVAGKWRVDFASLPHRTKQYVGSFSVRQSSQEVGTFANHLRARGIAVSIMLEPRTQKRVYQVGLV